jgi:hypothetical protein
LDIIIFLKTNVPSLSLVKDKNMQQANSDTLQTETSTYIDEGFLNCKELDPLSLALDMIKTEWSLRKKGIQSTVVLFGSARIPEPGHPALSTQNTKQKNNLELASFYYEHARTFARLCSQYSAKTCYREFTIVTGGGPGIMEAGNRGASDVGAPSIGLNIMLPHEQKPNSYITPELSFKFHYFAIRKIHFLMRAKALAVFPGGFGTFDELFEALTMIQTGRMKRVPILMFGKTFWKKACNIDYLAEQGTISHDDMNLFEFIDTAIEGWDKIKSFYNL